MSFVDVADFDTDVSETLRRGSKRYNRSVITGCCARRPWGSTRNGFDVLSDGRRYVCVSNQGQSDLRRQFRAMG